MIKYEISADTPNSFAIWVDADVGAEDANVLSGKYVSYTHVKWARATYTFTVIIQQRTVMSHLRVLDQFWGLVGSFGPSQVTLLGSS